MHSGIVGPETLQSLEEGSSRKMTNSTVIVKIGRKGVGGVGRGDEGTNGNGKNTIKMNF